MIIRHPEQSFDFNRHDQIQPAATLVISSIAQELKVEHKVDSSIIPGSQNARRALYRVIDRDYVKDDPFNQASEEGTSNDVQP
jgi:hypothetical protein